jgi:hypothetical protein
MAMFTTCAFCGGALAGDGGPSGLGVGRRFAFDEWKGRLWVVCRRCTRWNLTPLDDRLERIEDVDRAASAGRVLAASGEITLIRAGSYEFIRVGQPPRTELATWRYGERLRSRARDRAKVVIPLTIIALGLGVAANVAAGGSLGIFVWNLHRVADAAYVGLVGRRRIRLDEPLVCARCGSLMDLRARHVKHARLVPQRRSDLAVVVSCPACHSEAGLLTGGDALVLLRQGLTYLNATREGRRRAEAAARLVDTAGGSEELIRVLARREARLEAVEPDRRLALEMAVDERQEVRELERRWREAEEIAEIADGVLSTEPEIEEHLRRLRKK